MILVVVWLLSRVVVFETACHPQRCEMVCAQVDGSSLSACVDLAE